MIDGIKKQSAVRSLKKTCESEEFIKLILRLSALIDTRIYISQDLLATGNWQLQTADLINRCLPSYLGKMMRIMGNRHVADMSDEELEAIWGKLFKGANTILFTEMLQPQRLLEWLKTAKGRSFLEKALAD